VQSKALVEEAAGFSLVLWFTQLEMVVAYSLHWALFYLG
jgi:hypothetical protein